MLKMLLLPACFSRLQTKILKKEEGGWKMLNQLKEKAGFISLETIIVAGLMVALGAFAIGQYYNVAQMHADHTENAINRVMDIEAL